MTDMSDNIPEPRVLVRHKKAAKAPKAVPAPDPTQHQHRVLNGRDQFWNATCKVCVEADRNRAPVPPEDLANTIFLYPGESQWTAICYEWLQRRYAGYTIHAYNQFALWQFVSDEDFQIVCVRPVADMHRELPPHEIQVVDTLTQRLSTLKQPNEKMLPFIAESAPIKFSEVCFLTQGAGMGRGHASYNIDELKRSLNEAFVQFCVQIPERKHPDDCLVVRSK